MIIKELLGILLIVAAWVDPFNLGTNFQVLFFILGFDLTGLILKILLFTGDIILGFSGFGWYLLILIIIEALFYFLKLKFVSHFAKPVAIFLIIFTNGLGWILGIVVAGIDLLLNISKKYI